MPIGASCVIITRDKGFGDFVFRGRRRVGVILVPLHKRSSEMAELISVALADRDDWDELFTVIEDDRVRVGRRLRKALRAASRPPESCKAR